jgi:hypothetical protein
MCISGLESLPNSPSRRFGKPSLVAVSRRTLTHRLIVVFQTKDFPVVIHSDEERAP